MDALVVITAALHVPAQILTSDSGDLAAYAARTLRSDLMDFGQIGEEADLLLGEQ